METSPRDSPIRVEPDAIRALAGAVNEMSGHLRTIKLLLIAYSAVTVLGIVTSVVMAMTGLVDEIMKDYPPPDFHTESDEIGSLTAGDDLPQIRLEDANGRTWPNEDWSGKPLLVNFWATWCPPCLEEVPLFNQALATHSESGLTIVGISVDRQGWDAVRPLIEEHEPSDPVLVADGSITRGFGQVNRLPTTYFVHPDGSIHKKWVGSLPEFLLDQEI